MFNLFVYISAVVHLCFVSRTVHQKLVTIKIGVLFDAARIKLLISGRIVSFRDESRRLGCEDECKFLNVSAHSIFPRINFLFDEK